MTARNDGPVAFPGVIAQDVVTRAGQAADLDGVAVTSGALAPGESVLGPTLCTPVSYRNGAVEPVSFNSLFDWKLQDPNGAIRTATFTGTKDPLRSGQLAPGGRATGDVCFDARNGKAGQYVVLYDPAFRFGTERIAWLNPR